MRMCFLKIIIAIALFVPSDEQTAPPSDALPRNASEVGARESQVPQEVKVKVGTGPTPQSCSYSSQPVSSLPELLLSRTLHILVFLFIPLFFLCFPL